MAALSFNADEVEPRDDFTGELLPAGTYTVEILATEQKPTKSGTGTVLKIEHAVIDPEKHAKRRLWKYINVTNANAQAESIGRSELSALCRAVGIAHLNDDEELIGKVVKAKVAIRKGNAKYPDDQNEIKSYESALVAPTPRQPPAQVNAKAAPPWQRQ